MSITATMSFRNRLTFFFVVIVIVPMVAVAVVLFRLISDNETGKADAGVRARAESAARIYTQDATSTTGAAAAATLTRDRILGQSLSSANLSRARRRATQLVGHQGVVRIVLVRGGRPALDVGDQTAVAPVLRDLVDTQGHSLGRLEVSITPAAAYAKQVRTITGVQVVVHVGSDILASTLPGVSPAALPPPQRGTDLRLRGVRYRVVSLPATGFADEPLQVSLLSNFQPTSSRIADSRLLAGSLIAVFFVIAFAFAILVSRSLQLQINGFLAAARRLGSGDFSTPVPIAGRDEFAALGEEFNKMSRQLEDRLDELREQQRRLEDALRRVGETFASNLDRDALLEIVLRTAIDGVNATAGRATVRGPSQRFEQTARVGDLGPYKDALRAVEASVLESHQAGVVEQDGISALGHPLPAAQDDGRVLALLSVARNDRPFDEAEQELFHYLAGQAAVSIENVDLHERVQLQAVTDELTGLFNHRRFHDAVAVEIERSKRFGQDLGLLMLDIDDFKAINDTYGHQQGDLVLQQVARIVRENSREIDAPARYGGEELAVVLPGTNLEGAYNVAERVRIGIEQLRLPRLDSRGTITVTASLGVAAEVPPADADAGRLIAAADNALYEAKRSGKNKTVRAE